MSNKKPLGKLQTALIITATVIGGLSLGGVGGYFIGHYMKPATIDIGNLDADDFEDKNDDLLTKYEKSKSEGKDPLETFSIADLANISIQKFLTRDHYVAYGFGMVYSALNIEIRNCNARSGDKAMEESVSMGNGIINVRVAQRDYMNADNIDSHLGNIGDNLDSVAWNGDVKDYDYDEYTKTFGKLPDSCFNYIISNKTVLDSSAINRTESGYELHLQLDTVGSVVRYIRRMMNLSGSQVSQFYDVQFVMNTDDDFNLITTSINETYSACMANVPAKCNGQITTYYKVDEDVKLPELGDSINYSAIAKELGI